MKINLLKPMSRCIENIVFFSFFRLFFYRYDERVALTGSIKLPQQGDKEKYNRKVGSVSRDQGTSRHSERKERVGWFTQRCQGSKGVGVVISRDCCCGKKWEDTLYAQTPGR